MKDYRKYKMNITDILKTAFQSILITAAIAYLFYDSMLVFIILPVVFFVMSKRCILDSAAKQRQQLTVEFMDMLKSISSNLIAGFSLENSWREAEKEIEQLYGKKSIMLPELKDMNRKLEVNEPLEKILEEFARRTDVDDIENFAAIFSFAKRSGGRFVDIIETTTYRMWEKFETKKEIEVAVSAKKYEQKAMNAIPLFILLFLKTASSDYMSVLYGNAIGAAFMSVCLAAYAVSIMLASRILDIEI